MALVELRNVIKDYVSDDQKVRALDGVSLCVAPGEVVAFEAKLLRPAGVTSVIECQQLAACATRGKMQRIGKINSIPAVA